MVLGLMALLAACEGKPARRVKPPAVGQAELPGWFGLPEEPSRRIAGYLHGGDGPLSGTVHLRMEAPDATAWRGLDRETGADGRFDFGEVRAGRYNILATAPGKTSRVVEVDTRSGAADALHVYAHPCKHVIVAVKGEDRAPLQGAQVDLEGLVVETTDKAGRAKVCLTHENTRVSVRAAGFGPEALWLAEWIAVTDFKLAAATPLRGRIVDQAGSGVAGVAVQPVLDKQHLASHGPDEWPVPIHTVTDLDGRFTLAGVRRLEGDPDYQQELLVAQYHLRVLSHDKEYEIATPILQADATAEPVAILPIEPSKPEPTAPEGTHATLSGRVFYKGKPLADARVSRAQEHEPTYPTRTDPDGSFRLEVDGDGEMYISFSHAIGIFTHRMIAFSSGQHIRDVTIHMEVAE